jgi:flagellar hook assembly protein FlgD
MDGDKVVSAGFTLTTSIWEINSSGENMIHQNYPNPFSNYTNIPYQLKQEGDVELTITDITGRTVWSISKKAQTPGHHIIQWNAHDISGQQVVKGIYFMQIKITTPVERFLGEKKLVIM